MARNIWSLGFFPSFGRVWYKLSHITITKRQKFVFVVMFLTIGLFIAENLFGRSGIYIAILLAILTDVLFIIIMYPDLKGNFAPAMLILPFLYSLSCGLFFFLAPPRFLTRFMMTLVYAVGLYSLFLSHNIFIVAAIRTIALLTGARIVSFILTILAFFFLTTVVFSLHLPILPVLALVFAYSFFLIIHALWTVSLEKKFFAFWQWNAILAFCVTEMALLIWFWPALYYFIAIFLTGFFYTVVGLSQAWFDKRLFRNVLWEYIWVSAIVLCILLFFTTWNP